MSELWNRREVIKGLIASAIAILCGGRSNPVQAFPPEGPDTPLPTRLLGKTGVRVPILGFGTAPVGTRVALNEAVALYHTAIDSGVTYLDTAPSFAGYGEAQKQLGHVLKERRREVFVVTKCFEPYGEAAFRLLERSLKELQTDHADLVFVHSLGDDKMDPRIVFSREGTYPALMKAKAQGLTRFVGLSGHNRTGRFEEAIRDCDVDVLLNVTNFVDQHTYSFEERLWPLAVQKGIGLVGMKVYGGAGPSPRALSSRMLPKEHLDLAFRYALSVPSIACAVIGMATREELQENLRRAKAFRPLSDQERASLRSIGEQLARQWGPHFGDIV
jgi:predicted aldo/keto reductase-like oxidoreductase